MYFVVTDRTEKQLFGCFPEGYINQDFAGKTILEVGTGCSFTLPIMLLAAGAQLVYAHDATLDMKYGGQGYQLDSIIYPTFCHPQIQGDFVAGREDRGLIYTTSDDHNLERINEHVALEAGIRMHDTRQKLIDDLPPQIVPFANFIRKLKDIKELPHGNDLVIDNFAIAYYLFDHPEERLFRHIKNLLSLTAPGGEVIVTAFNPQMSLVMQLLLDLKGYKHNKAYRIRGDRRNLNGLLIENTKFPEP